MGTDSLGAPLSETAGSTVLFVAELVVAGGLVVVLVAAALPGR